MTPSPVYAMRKNLFRWMTVVLSCAAILLMLAGRPIQVRAGVYVFAENAGADIITHPTGYDGTGGELVIRVGIVPGSPNADKMVVPVQNIISVYNNLEVSVGNLIRGEDNNIPYNGIDFESVALHELGHALGLAHPNLASESGLSGADRNYTKSTRGPNAAFDVNPGPDAIIGSGDDIRGDDANLHWFNRDVNDPFTLEDTIDASTYSRSLVALPSGDSFAVNADRTVADDMGYAGTEAVMQQLTFIDEAQRTLVGDDVATLWLASAGVDEVEGTGDDYTFRLVYADMGADILVSFDNGETGFAVTRLTGQQIAPSASHVAIISARIYFNTGFNWFFNSVPPAEDVIYVESGAVCGGKAPCYATIQEGIDAAAAGGPGVSISIRVADGTYTEAPLFRATGEILLDGGWDSDFSVNTENPVGIDPGTGVVVFSRGRTVLSGMIIQ